MKLGADSGGGERRAEGGSPSALLTDRSVAQLRGERKLVERVYARCHAHILESSAYSSVPVEFWGALAANESGGDAKAARFEPAVYRHLKAVAAGKAPTYGGTRARDLGAEVEEMLHPKVGQYHARFLAPPFAARHGEEIAALEDEALRELASSWGFTQIMGYHMVGRAGTVRDLLELRFHFRLAIELLAGFAEHFQIDLSEEFEEMFRCWNAGSPYGETTDPAYAANGLRRMEIYREIAKGH